MINFVGSNCSIDQIYGWLLKFRDDHMINFVGSNFSIDAIYEWLF